MRRKQIFIHWCLSFSLAKGQKSSTYAAMDFESGQRSIDAWYFMFSICFFRASRSMFAKILFVGVVFWEKREWTNCYVFHFPSTTEKEIFIFEHLDEEERKRQQLVFPFDMLLPWIHLKRKRGRKFLRKENWGIWWAGTNR